MTNGKTNYNQSKNKRKLHDEKTVISYNIARDFCLSCQTPINATLSARAISVFTFPEFNSLKQTLPIWKGFRSIWKNISQELLGNQRLPAQSNWLVNRVLTLKDLFFKGRRIKDSYKIICLLSMRHINSYAA